MGHFFDLSFTNVAAGPAQRRGVAAFARQFDSRADRGAADFDQKHNLVFYSVWDLPDVFSSSKAAPVFRNWKFAQFAAFRSGFPFTVFAASRFLEGAGQILNQRADLVDPTSASKRIGNAVPGGKQLLKPVIDEAFSQPPPGRLGSSGRNAFRGSGLYNIDISVSRVFRPQWLGESGHLSLRADAFNVLNHANLNSPESLLGSETFGQAFFGRRGRDTGFPALTPFRETARQVQLMLRFEF